jgi:hypothetical protein
LVEAADRLFGLAALCGAAAFAFAGVFALAALVAGFATALAFTGVLSFTGVRPFVPHSLKRNSSLGGCVGCMDANRQRSGHETGYRGACDECFRCFHLVFCFLLLSFSFSAEIRRESLKMGLKV